MVRDDRLWCRPSGLHQWRWWRVRVLTSENQKGTISATVLATSDTGLVGQGQGLLPATVFCSRARRIMTMAIPALPMNATAGWPDSIEPVSLARLLIWVRSAPR